MDDGPLRHEAPAWGFEADDELALPPEVLPVRRVGGDGDDDVVEVCAVPIRLPRLALGDAVRRSTEGFEVVRRSGHGTVHLWLGDSFLPRADLVDALVGLGAVVERSGENLLAVDVAPSVATAVLGLLAGHAERGEVQLRLSQPAVAPLTEPERGELSVRVTGLTRTRAEALGPDDVARVLDRVADGEPVLALEKLLPMLPEHDVVLTPDEHAELMALMALAGLSTELLPAYGIRLTAPSPNGPALAQATIVEAARDWPRTELQWPGGDRVELSLQTISADTQSFRLASDDDQLLVVGPAFAQRVGPYVVVSGFSYAEIVRRHRPYHRVGAVVTDGEIVLGPVGAPDYRADDADNATARMPDEVARLRDLLAAPGGVRRLTRRWTWGELFLPICLGVITAIFAFGLTSDGTSAAPLLLLVPALALIAGPVVHDRGRRAGAGRRFRAEGWIAGGTPYGSGGRDLLQLLLPEELPVHQRHAVTGKVTALLARPESLTAVLQLLRDPITHRSPWHVTSGVSLRQLDRTLPSKAVVHLLSRAHPPGGSYAVVPRRTGSVVDVLEIRADALRTTGLLP